MKKFWLFILGLFLLFLVCNFSQAKDYEYTNLNITANILNDWTINVKEDFAANFFVNKHWIIRDIPLNYSVDWKKFHIEISNIKVQWKKFTTSKSNWERHIKIWDANETVIWEQNYPISYTTYWLIRNFSWMWYAELYWNLVWYDFDTNINKIRAELILPKIYTWFTKDDFLITTNWNSKTIDWFEWTVDWSSWDRIIITYDKWLSAYHWITLAIKFPNDYFEFDNNKQAKLVWNVRNKTDTIGYSWNRKQTLDLSNSLGWISIFFVFILICIGFIIHKTSEKLENNLKINLKSWFQKWKFSKKIPIVVWYTPPKWLNSAEVWLLLHRWAEIRDMLSLIYKWAIEWLISISIEKDENDEVTPIMSKKTIVIKRNDNIPQNYPDYEYKLFNQLVPGKTNEIDPSAGLWFKLDTSSLEEYGQDKWWITKTTNPDTKNVLFMLFWIILILLSVWLFKFGFVLWFCCIIISFLIILSRKNFKETEEWEKLISQILWYREFLTTCDENKLRLFLKEDPLYFDKTLPYAIVFWLETELINKITPIMEEMNIKSNLYGWDVATITSTITTLSSFISSSESSYSSSSWFSSWSSFDSWWSDFDSWWGWWWWGWSSW